MQRLKIVAQAVGSRHRTKAMTQVNIRTSSAARAVAPMKREAKADLSSAFGDGYKIPWYGRRAVLWLKAIIMRCVFLRARRR
jgi:hypothetical protein